MSHMCAALSHGIICTLYSVLCTLAYPRHRWCGPPPQASPTKFSISWGPIEAESGALRRHTAVARYPVGEADLCNVAE